MGIEAQELEPFSVAFLVHKQGTRLKVEQLGLKLASIWDGDSKGKGLAHYAPELAADFLKFIEHYTTCVLMSLS